MGKTRQEIKDNIISKIYENEDEQITGQDLQDVLVDMTDNLGLEDDVTNLQTRLEDAEDDIDSLQDDVEDLQGDVEDLDENKVGSNGTVTTIISLTQAQYDALTTKDPNTVYIIKPSN